MKNFVSTHWGTYETSKKNGKNIKINKWSKDPNPSDFGLGFLKSATDDLRINQPYICLLYTSPSPRDRTRSRMPSSA